MIRNFLVQIQVTRPGTEVAKALRRKRADQVCGHLCLRSQNFKLLDD